jgi:hypothetical protein
MLTSLEKTGRAGLLDVASLALGPLGPLVTRGLSLVDAAGAAQRAGTTRILQSRIELAADSGLLQFEDVAFVTPKHRVALTGGIDLARGAFKGTKMATLDARGCAIYVEKIEGTLEDPRVRATRILAKTVVSPLTTVLGTASALLGPKCEPFYTGQVPPPPHKEQEATQSPDEGQGDSGPVLRPRALGGERGLLRR